VALDRPRPSLPLVVVDLGYSAKAKSCGLAWTGGKSPIQVRFGEAIALAAEQLGTLREPVLVLEAVLSTFHNRVGNPEIRGDFEKGRGWYWGPGAVSLVSACRFLQQLAAKLTGSKRVLLAEAFLSNKPRRTGHSEDAATILDDFWSRESEALRHGVEPVLDLIEGVPPVRVFKAPSGQSGARDGIIKG